MRATDPPAWVKLRGFHILADNTRITLPRSCRCGGTDPGRTASTPWSYSLASSTITRLRRSPPITRRGIPPFPPGRRGRDADNNPFFHFFSGEFVVEARPTYLPCTGPRL